MPLEFAKIWRVAQSRTEKPVKFGTISADLAATVLTLQTDAYDDDKRQLMWDMATVLNARAARARRRRLQGDPDRGAGDP